MASGRNHVQINSNDYTQAQVDTSHSAQYQSVPKYPSDTIGEFLREYRKHLRMMNESNRYWAERNLKVVEEELRRGPVTSQNDALREALWSLRNIAEGATGGVVFAGLVELANRIHL